MQLAWRHTLGFFLAIAVLTPALATAQDAPENQAPHDTVFNEIELTPEGVTAYDTAGVRWYYDFEDEAFVPGYPPDGTQQARITAGTEGRGAVPPVQERCTEEIRVPPSEAKVTVGWNKYVDGDVVALGQVTVNGWVRGNVQSYGGRVLVTETGQVDGDIRAPEIQVKPGGRVGGEVYREGTIVTLPGDIFDHFSADGIWVVLGFTIFLLLIGFIAITLAPRQMDRFNQCITRYPGRSFAMGLLFTLLAGPITALAALTLIGAILVPLSYVAAYMLGIVSLSYIVGRWLWRRFAGGPSVGALAFVSGLAPLMILWFIVAVLLGATSSVANGFGTFFLVMAILITVFPICAGAGAALLTRFGFREYSTMPARKPQEAEYAPTPAPPPIPSEPPVVTPPVRRFSSEDEEEDEEEELNERPPSPPLSPGG